MNLRAEFEMPQHVGGGGGRRGHDIAMLVEPARRPVVVDEAVLAQHQAVSRPADGQLGEAVAIDPIQQSAGVGADDFDLAERRDVA